MPRRLVVATLPLALSLLVVSCGDDGGGSGSGGSPVGTWSITELVVDGTPLEVVDGSDPTLTLEDDGSAAVTTGCNNGATTWESEGDSLTFGLVAGTLMACEDDLMAQQDAIFGALEASASFEVGSGELTLLDADGETVLVAEST